LFIILQKEKNFWLQLLQMIVDIVKIGFGIAIVVLGLYWWRKSLRKVESHIAVPEEADVPILPQSSDLDWGHFPVMTTTEVRRLKRRLKRGITACTASIIRNSLALHHANVVRNTYESSQQYESYNSTRRLPVPYEVARRQYIVRRDHYNSITFRKNDVQRRYTSSPCHQGEQDDVDVKENVIRALKKIRRRNKSAECGIELFMNYGRQMNFSGVVWLSMESANL